MTLQAIELNDPRYTVSFEPKYHQECFTEKDFRDDEDNQCEVTIAFDWYYDDKQENKRILQCRFDPKPPYRMTDESLVDGVKNLVEFEYGPFGWDSMPEKYEHKF